MHLHLGYLLPLENPPEGFLQIVIQTVNTGVERNLWSMLYT